jgi:1-pyrroline-5-carboxylate dehydrogenase
MAEDSGKHQKNTYKVYPRIVGETGGKDFLFAHRDCNIKAMSEALFCGAFEYQGQKCSAISRAYIPRSIWPQVSGLLKDRCSRASLGYERSLGVHGAVIDEKAFKKIVSYIELAKASPGNTE